MPNTSGFSLPELLLSMAIVAIIGGVSMPVYYSFLARNDLYITAEAVAASFRRAQLYSRAVNGDSTWGVNIQPSSVTLYKGVSFASRDSSYDEVTSLPATLSASGLSDVTFSKLTALPNTTGTVTITTTANETKAIAINAKGMVAY